MYFGFMVWVMVDDFFQITLDAMRLAIKDTSTESLIDAPDEVTYRGAAGAAMREMSNAYGRKVTRLKSPKGFSSFRIGGSRGTWVAVNSVTGAVETNAPKSKSYALFIDLFHRHRARVDKPRMLSTIRKAMHRCYATSIFRVYFVPKPMEDHLRRIESFAERFDGLGVWMLPIYPTTEAVEFVMSCYIGNAREEIERDRVRFSEWLANGFSERGVAKWRAKLARMRQKDGVYRQMAGRSCEDVISFAEKLEEGLQWRCEK